MGKNKGWDLMDKLISFTTWSSTSSPLFLDPRAVFYKKQLFSRKISWKEEKIMDNNGFSINLFGKSICLFHPSPVGKFFFYHELESQGTRQGGLYSLIPIELWCDKNLKYVIITLWVLARIMEEIEDGNLNGFTYWGFESHFIIVMVLIKLYTQFGMIIWFWGYIKEIWWVSSWEFIRNSELKERDRF